MRPTSVEAKACVAYLLRNDVSPNPSAAETAQVTPVREVMRGEPGFHRTATERTTARDRERGSERRPLALHVPSIRPRDSRAPLVASHSSQRAPGAMLRQDVLAAQ